jgi:hypothetical protein
MFGRFCRALSRTIYERRYVVRLVPRAEQGQSWQDLP